MFHIQFNTPEQINLLLAALAKQPYEVSAPLIETVRTQAQKQLEEAEAAKAAGQQNAGLTE